VRARALVVVAVVAIAACYRRTCPSPCAPVSTDEPCAACLRARCCHETIDWFHERPDAGAAAAECVEVFCYEACTRPERR
jgi:hypothetical protein